MMFSAHGFNGQYIYVVPELDAVFVVLANDVTDLPEVASGDEAVIVGRQAGAEIPLTEFSRLAETIPWETLCSVTKRVPRHYRTSLGV